HDFEDYLAPEAKLASASTYMYLDVGAAEGDITAALARRLRLPRERACAVDVRPAAPRPEFTFALTDGQRLPWDGATFELLTMFMSAHHFADAPAMFAEAARVARP